MKVLCIVNYDKESVLVLQNLFTTPCISSLSLKRTLAKTVTIYCILWKRLEDRFFTGCLTVYSRQSPVQVCTPLGFTSPFSIPLALHNYLSYLLFSCKRHALRIVYQCDQHKLKLKAAEPKVILQRHVEWKGNWFLHRQWKSEFPAAAFWK